jgi:hypothetical protein
VECSAWPSYTLCCIQLVCISEDMNLSTLTDRMKSKQLPYIGINSKNTSTVKLYEPDVLPQTLCFVMIQHNYGPALLQPKKRTHTIRNIMNTVH